MSESNTLPVEPVWWTSWNSLDPASISILEFIDRAALCHTCVKTRWWFDARCMLKYPRYQVRRLDAVLSGNALAKALLTLES